MLSWRNVPWQGTNSEIKSGNDHVNRKWAESNRRRIARNELEPRQRRQRAPVVEAFLPGAEQRSARVAVFVEMFREAASGAREAEEVIDLAGLRVDEENLVPSKPIRGDL